MEESSDEDDAGSEQKNGNLLFSELPGRLLVRMLVDRVAFISRY
jgi:hypothetical protein